MKRTNLLLVCGLAAAISSPALAQNQPGQRPGEEPGRQPGQQPGQDRDMQQRQTRLGQQGQQDAQNVLKQLEGSWHIEIKMDPKLFGKDASTRPSSRQPGQERDPLDRDPTRDRDPTDPTRDRDPTDPTQRDRDPTQPGQQDRPDTERVLGSGQDNMVTSRGYSQNRLILNDKVLHEAAVIISGGEGAAAAQSGSEQIQALSFLGFDDQSQQYSFVLMTDRSGKFNCNHGKFDAGQRRITFEKDSSMRSGAQMGQSGQLSLDNVKIVLEIVSNDEHKVTMYDTSATSRTIPGQPDREREGQEDRTPGVDRPGGQQDRTLTGQDAQGKIVYEATYTRADGDVPGAGQPGQQPGQDRPGQTPGQRPGQDRPGGGG